MCQQWDMPCAPIITEDNLNRCRSSKDYSPVLFEWYKYVAELSNFFSRLRPDSPVFIQIDAINHAIFVGLLNRCSRLMLANIKLSSQGLYGETTSIIDRCIFETCIKMIWLCHNNTQEKFKRYLSDGFKAEFKLRNKINENIGSRGG